MHDDYDDDDVDDDDDDGGDGDGGDDDDDRDDRDYRGDDGDDEDGDKNLFGAICFPSTQMKKTTSRHPQPRRKTTYANYREGATPVTHHGETGLITSISQPAISN
jgi:hypothetical protein